MNWDRIEGNWKQLKGKVRERWGKLTDDQLEDIAGKKDKLAGKIQELYGISKDEAGDQVERFQKSMADTVDTTERKAGTGTAERKESPTMRPASQPGQPGHGQQQQR